MEERPVEFGGALRRLREESGLSQSALSARIHYSKGYLSKVETGKATGNREFAKACDDALTAGGVLAALVRERAERQETGDVVTAITGLPPTTPHFTGRSAELARIAAFVASEVGETACVLSGMAGAGKTALGLRASWDARESFPDGCLFLDLRGHALGTAMATAHDALDPLLRLLGVPGEQIPPHVDARANLYRSRLRGKRVLLFFDNVRSAAQVAPLLPAEPRCRVIITSRNRLNALDDAVHLPVDVLPEREAVVLFRAVGGDRARAAADDVVGRVVERCGRLPLAIRIAAARFRGSPLWTVEDFEQRLADETSRLDVLDDGERSVAAAFSLSCQALTDEQLRLFGLLALHPGRDVEIRTTAALADAGLAHTRNLVDHLGDAHLVAHDTPDHLAVHDLVREFARDRVLPGITADEQAAAVLRMLDHNLLLAESSDEFLAPHRFRPPFTPNDLPEVSEKFTDRESALTWIDVEWPNLVGLCHLAAARGLHRLCWQLAYILRDFFFLAKLWDPWIDTHLVAASSARAVGDSKALAMTLDNLGMAHVDRGDLEVAVGYFEEALELFRELEDEHGITDALSNLAWAALYLDDHQTALRGLREVMESYRGRGRTRSAAIALRGVALVETELGRYSEAVAHAEQARGEFEGLALHLDVVMSVNCAGWAHFQAGDHGAAVGCYGEAVELGERCGSRYEVARALTGLGNVREAAGRHGEAVELWAKADGVHGGLNPVMIGEARVRFGLSGFV
ncbi:tetratricopeptide repeat protein [Umezawaea endophytica]|uniref:Tetratricopeptide repeat protein n=1 Tax=Umezawaea endophytica TaxID=1654476 RepID=A0A9X3A2M9_9PSEU|nr:helix-turn-helix domain-containing protein [Umezawaea endophytica]MCS7479233.1 tetratricopeptide repeat protein [Umezawaea endophytica]